MKYASLPLALRGDLGLRASAAGGIDHQRQLHQRMAAISELVVLAVLHPRQLKVGKQPKFGQQVDGLSSTLASPPTFKQKEREFSISLPTR